MKEVELATESKWAVDNDICPVLGCCGPLDTGWECQKCGYDAMRIAVGPLGFLWHKIKVWYRSR